MRRIRGLPSSTTPDLTRPCAIEFVYNGDTSGTGSEREGADVCLVLIIAIKEQRKRQIRRHRLQRQKVS